MSKVKRCVELSRQEAEILVAENIYETLVNDANYLKELILEDGFDDHFGPVKNFTDEALADRIFELNLAEKIAQDNDAEMVVLRLNQISNFVVYEREDELNINTTAVDTIVHAG